MTSRPRSWQDSWLNSHNSPNNNTSYLYHIFSPKSAECSTCHPLAFHLCSHLWFRKPRCRQPRRPDGNLDQPFLAVGQRPCLIDSTTVRWLRWAQRPRVLSADSFPSKPSREARGIFTRPVLSSVWVFVISSALTPVTGRELWWEGRGRRSLETHPWASYLEDSLEALSGRNSAGTVMMIPCVSKVCAASKPFHSLCHCHAITGVDAEAVILYSMVPALLSRFFLCQSLLNHWALATLASFCNMDKPCSFSCLKELAHAVPSAWNTFLFSLPLVSIPKASLCSSYIS